MPVELLREAKNSPPYFIDFCRASILLRAKKHCTKVEPPTPQLGGRRRSFFVQFPAKSVPTAPSLLYLLVPNFVMCTCYILQALVARKHHLVIRLNTTIMPNSAGIEANRKTTGRYQSVMGTKHESHQINCPLHRQQELSFHEKAKRSELKAIKGVIYLVQINQ